VLSKAQRDYISNNPVEIIAGGIGIFIVAVGVFLGTQSGIVSLLGQILSIVGAILSSMATAWTLGRKASETKVAANLDILASQLETSISQIHRSVRMGLENSQQPNIYFARIEQCIGNLMGVIHEFGKITGRQTPFEAGEVLKVRGVLAEFGQMLDSEPAARIPQLHHLVTSMKENVEGLLDRLEESDTEAVRALAAERKMVVATEPCPNCRKPVIFQIGNMPGDSAMPTCESCGQRFHAHRSSSGSIFVRVPGGVRQRKISVFCPVCTNRVPANIEEGQQEAEERFCFSCGSKISINPSNNECTLVSKKEKLKGRFDEFGTFKCEKCGEPAILLTANNHGTFGVCKKDDSLVVLPLDPGALAAPDSH
jgi:hypothetical protein